MMTHGRWKQSILSVTINLGYEKNYEDETRVYPSMVSIYRVKPIISDCQNVYCFIFPNLTQSKESNIKKIMILGMHVTLGMSSREFKSAD